MNHVLANVIWEEQLVVPDVRKAMLMHQMMVVLVVMTVPNIRITVMTVPNIRITVIPITRQETFLVLY